jgi:hypothetical protein
MVHDWTEVASAVAAVVGSATSVISALMAYRAQRTAVTAQKQLTAYVDEDRRYHAYVDQKRSALAHESGGTLFPPYSFHATPEEERFFVRALREGFFEREAAGDRVSTFSSR